MNTAQEPIPKPTYPQNWPAYNRAQMKERELFQRLLFALCQQVDEPPRKEGAGRNRLPLSDMIFAVVFKTYSVVSGRRFISELKEVAEKGYISKTPHYNSIFNYFEHDSMNWILRDMIVETSTTLRDFEIDFAADSSGFSTGRFTRWFVEKHLGQKRHFPDRHINWLKCHIMCGVKTNVVTAVEITSRYAADTTQFPAMLDQTRETSR